MAKYDSFDYIVGQFDDVTKLGGYAQFSVIGSKNGIPINVDNNDIEWSLIPPEVGFIASHIDEFGNNDNKAWVHITNYPTPSTSNIYLIAKGKYDNTLFCQYPPTSSIIQWKIKSSDVNRVDICDNPNIKGYQKINYEQEFKGIVVYEDGTFSKDDNLVWDTNSPSIISATSKTTSNGIVGRVLSKDEGIAQLKLKYSLDENISDTLTWNSHKSIVRLKINETPNEKLKQRMGKQIFTVTKVYDTGEEELVSPEDMNNLEWTVTPSGAASINPTTGEATSYDISALCISQIQDNEAYEFNTDVTLRVDWRGKNGEVAPQYIDTVSIDEDGNEITNKILNPDYVECDQVHWRIQKNVIGIKIVGFDKNIPPNQFSMAPSYAVESFNSKNGLKRVKGEQEFRAIFTYDDGTTTPLIRKKEIYKKHIKNPKKLGEDRNGTPIIGTEINNENKFGFLDTFGETNDIIWTLQYIYQHDDGSEYYIDWKDNHLTNENQLNKIADLYTYPYKDKLEDIITYKENPKKLGEDRNGTPIIGTEITDMSDAPNRTANALIAHVTALRGGKARLYCTYINDPSIYDWIDFEIERKIDHIRINETPNEIVRQVGGSQQFSVTAYYDDGYEELITDHELIQWNIIDGINEAEIDMYGNVTTLAKGTIKIQATVKDIKSNIVMYNVDKDIVGVRINSVPDNLRIDRLNISNGYAYGIGVGETTIFEGLWIYDDGSESPVTNGQWTAVNCDLIDEWIENGTYKCSVKSINSNNTSITLIANKGTITRTYALSWVPNKLITRIELEVNDETLLDEINEQPQFRIKVFYNDGSEGYLSDTRGVEII